MSMTRECTGICDFSGSWATETVGNLCASKTIKEWTNKWMLGEFSDIHSMCDVTRIKLAFISAFWYLIGPHADTCFTIVCQSRWALVAAGFAVPAIPEDIAFIFIGEDTVQARTVWRWYCWFCCGCALANGKVREKSIECEKMLIGGGGGLF